MVLRPEGTGGFSPGFQETWVETLVIIHNSEKRRIPGKHRLMVRTLQAGSLCYIAFGTGTRGMEILLQALPRTRRDMATA
jgi:hypothetical protein